MLMCYDCGVEREGITKLGRTWRCDMCGTWREIGLTEVRRGDGK